MSLIRVVGLDPALRNWGIARGTYDIVSKRIDVDSLGIVQPVLPKGKQVRQNSIDLEAARQLYAGALQACEDAQAIFVEVPVGSQSARAMASYGICVGILGGLRASGTNFFELTPVEVKLAAVGHKTASKAEMIDWARRAYPFANWPTYRANGQEQVTEAKAEHMADAIAAIHAGITSNAFQQLLPFLTAAPNYQSATQLKELLC